MLVKTTIASVLLPTLVAACHKHIERRAVNAARGATLDRSSEASERLVLDPDAECSPYGYAPVNDLMASYPPIWVTGTLQFAGVPDDATDLYNSIKAGIPSIAPRGTRAGDFTGVTYDANADIDCWWTETRCTQPKLKGLANDVTRCPEPNTWGFTLDDGPNCSHNAYFDYLESIKMKATLFYIGSNVLDWPLEAQRGLADGHEICSHTWSHPYMTSMTNEEAFAELYFSKKAIKDVLGVTVRCWRPPYGDVDDRIRYIAEALDMQTVVWNADTDDYNWVTLGMAAIRKNYQAIFDQQTEGEYNTAGVIVLTHEIDNGTMQLSEEMLPQMMKQFTGGVMPIAVCMNNSQPYVETADYTYPNYDQWTAGTRSISLASPTATGVASETLVLLTGSAAPTSTSSTVASSASVRSVSRASSSSQGAAASASASSLSASAAAHESASAPAAQADAQPSAAASLSSGALAGIAAVVVGAMISAAVLL